MSRIATKIWPLPEILTGETFQVKESPGGNHVCTDLPGKLMYVPSADSAEGRMSRLHEMAHVAITPTDGMAQATERGIKPTFINVAEDFRLDHYFMSNDFNLEQSLSPELLKNQAEGFTLKKDIKNAVLFAVCLRYLPEYDDFMNLLPYEWSGTISDVVWKCEDFLSGSIGFEQAMQIAEYLQELFESNALTEEISQKERYRKITQYGAKSGDKEWGNMVIVKPPLPIRLSAHRLNRRIRPKEYGDRIMFPSRLDEDDKIFGNMRRVARGTVLVDVSGSMSLSTEDIEEMIKAVPGVVVACYSGDDEEGHLTIIADKGSMMAINVEFPGGNVVDGPALRWLASQHKPLIWVCDGDVTGKYDLSADNLTEEAQKIAKENNILRIEDISRVPWALKQ